MAKLSARGATVLKRQTAGALEFVLRSDGVMLRAVRYDDGSKSGYAIYAKGQTPASFAERLQAFK